MTAPLQGLAKGKSILVTGGAGFIGSNIAELVSDEPTNDVVVLDDLSLGRMSNLDWAEGRPNCSFRRADVCDPTAMEHAMIGVDIVLHQAGIPGIQASIQDPLRTNRANVIGTLSSLESARRCDVEGFVLASSCAVYGDAAKPPISEEAQARPISPYGASKLAAESYCRAYCELYGIRAVALRYFNVYGPRQDPRSEYAAVIPKFIDLMLACEQPTIYGDGEQTRDFVYVADVARANCMAALTEGTGGRVYNVGAGDPVSINRLVEILNASMGCDLEGRHLPPRAGDITHSWADASRIKTEVGFETIFSLEEGLERTVAGSTSRR